MTDRKFDSHDRSDYTSRGITIQGKKTARKVSISGSPANYRAAISLGHHHDKKADASLKKFATDVIPVLRITALLALCKLGRADEYLQRLSPKEFYY